MPNNEEHSQHTLKRYGVRGDDIHEYLDAPSNKYRQSHRQFRHDTETIKLIGEIFGQKYGRVMAENIALDHITADHEEEIRKSKFVLFKCPNCGGKIDDPSNGQRICKYCGYETKVLDAEDNSSLKLPKRDWIVLLREDVDSTLPIAIPPLVLHYSPFIVDEIYSEFQDREDVEFVLNRLGYGPMTIRDFKLERNGALTDNEIRKVIINSKKITIEQMKELLSKGDLFLKRCSKCGKHVFEKDNKDYELERHYSNHQAIIKKGVICCRGCWEKMYPAKMPHGFLPCYIATAAYGTSVAREIKILRTFRDKKLNSTHYGRSIVALYYNTSPIIAQVISRSDNMRTVIRFLLNPIILNLRKRGLE